jgi:putative addiction module component (TIGR02574 family)
MVIGMLPVSSEVRAMQARKSELEREALRLPPQKRVRLLRLLVESFDDEVEADVEAAWIEEAKLRYEELRAGRVKGRTATQVHERARAGLAALK